MTAIKQVSVTSAAHLKSLSGYLNDERALMRDSQNLVDESRWAEEMDRTRETYGHNSPSRAGAAVTYMYHHVIGFNPDECSCNGGSMTPEKCMQFAREWVQGRYPNQEAVWVLHKEHCTADSTDRYAVHVGINRTDLETGNRLHEGGWAARQRLCARTPCGKWTPGGGCASSRRGGATPAFTPCSRPGPRRRCGPGAPCPTRT